MKNVTLIFVLLVQTVAIFGDNYALPVGEGDKERLFIQSNLCLPGTQDFLEKCAIAPGSRVLEIGCGLGLCAQLFARMVGEKGLVLATDISAEQLTLAQKLVAPAVKNISFKQLSVYDLPSLPEKFDVIYLRFVLCHLLDPAAVLALMKSALKPGGKIIIEDITGNDTIMSVPHTQAMGYVKKFDKLQFELEASDDSYFDKLPILLAVNGLSIRLLSRTHAKLDTPQKRSLLSLQLTSLRDALIEAGKITQEDYQQMHAAVKKFEKTDTDAFFYEIGQICCTVAVR